MGIVFLLLGLLPLMFLPDFLDQDHDSADAEPPLPPGHLPLDGEFSTNYINLLDDPDPDPDTEVDDETALLPVNQDDPPDDGTQNPDPQDILPPVDEDDVATPPDGDAEDPLQPVDEIDSLSADTWVNFDNDARLGYSKIEGFQAGQDVLHVMIDPASASENPDVEVRTTADGRDSLIFVEQHLVAIFINSTGVTVADIIVEFEASAT